MFLATRVRFLFEGISFSRSSSLYLRRCSIPRPNCSGFFWRHPSFFTGNTLKFSSFSTLNDENTPKQPEEPSEQNNSPTEQGQSSSPKDETKPTTKGKRRKKTKEISAARKDKDEKEEEFAEEEEAADKEETEVKDVLPPETEKVTGSSVQHEFQAETRKLLDIVARSLYTDKEVFVRELVSNASDALGKLRHHQLLGKAIDNADVPLEINVYTDSKKKTLTIQDTGIGMSKEELIKNLGSIGHSGSLEFVKNLQEKSATDIIGQFGVGFYSAFMVSSKVAVYSRSAIPGSTGYYWTSDGTGTYDISEAEGVARGTKIICYLNDNSHQFSEKGEIENIIKKYSNFVGFPIKLNGKQVNTIKPLWTMKKSEITEQDHKEFYQFISHAYDEPLYHLHYTTDSPINIRSLFYIGQQHSEKFGMPRMEGGVNLFTKKVLIQAKAKGILPDFLRFIRGVVDSEDLPLNLSREHLQDSALVKRINGVLTKRILKWLDEEAKKNKESYESFFEEFGNFIKEGICMEAQYKDDLAKLLRYESSHTKASEHTSLEQYIERMDKDDKNIFYLSNVQNRELADLSPYLEAFKKKNKEVLFLYTPMDDFVMNNLNEFKGKKFISVESEQASEFLKDKETPESSPENVKQLLDFIKNTLEDKVSSVKETTRLADSPAIIVGHDSATFRRMMKYVDPSRAPAISKQQLEVNASHPVMKKLVEMHSSKPNLAKLVIEQIYDDALAVAGLLDEARVMIPRLNKLLMSALDGSEVLPEKLSVNQPPESDSPAPSQEKEASADSSIKEETTERTSASSN